MPGGQFTNLKAQARSLGLEARWPEVAKVYAQANMIFGDIVKVTPSSKVEEAFPESVVDMLKGNLGQPEGGWPATHHPKSAEGEKPFTTRPGASATPIDLATTRAKVIADLKMDLPRNSSASLNSLTHTKEKQDGTNTQ